MEFLIPDTDIKLKLIYQEKIRRTKFSIVQRIDTKSDIKDYLLYTSVLHDGDIFKEFIGNHDLCFAIYSIANLQHHQTGLYRIEKFNKRHKNIDLVKYFLRLNRSKNLKELLS